MKKESIINVRTTPDFKQEVEAYAEALGLSASALIRMTLIERMKGGNNA